MKKVICALLSVVLIFSVAYAVEITQVNIDDLKKYEIMVGDPDGNMRFEDMVTRAEFAKMMCKMNGLSKATNISSFPDVAPGHWAIEYISIANSLKIMQGDAEGTFRPEGEISYAEAITVLVRLLGYEPIADTHGGYPVGHISTAKTLGITADITFDKDAAATREDVGIMIARALDTPILEHTSYGSENYYRVLNGINGEVLETLRTRLEPEEKEEYVPAYDPN